MNLSTSLIHNSGKAMAHRKTTSASVARKASKLLRRSPSISVRSVAGTALTQKHKRKR